MLYYLQNVFTYFISTDLHNQESYLSSSESAHFSNEKIEAWKVRYFPGSERQNGKTYLLIANTLLLPQYHTILSDERNHT